MKNEPKTDERLKPILAALKDKKAAVRQQALEDLGKLGDDGRPATDAVCQIVASDPSPAVRQSALDCLDKIYPDLSNKVVVLVVEADPLKHVKAVQEIGGLGEDARGAVPVLLTHLRTASARFPTDLDAIMSEDVRALGTVAPDDPAVQKALIESCKFSFVDRFGREFGQSVRSAAVTALGELVRKNPEQAKRIAPGLLTATKSMIDPEVRGQAIGILGTMAESDADLRPQIAPGLLTLIKAGDFNAISAIAKCGRDAKDALPLLKQLKLNPQEAVRTAVNDAITQIEDAVASAGKPTPKDEPTKPLADPPSKPRPMPVAEDATLPAELRAVAARVKAGPAEDRAKAAEELAAMGDKAKAASGVLCEAVLDSNQKVSHAALSALETINPDIKEPIFVLLVDDKAANHKEALGKLAALGEDGRPAAPVVRQEIEKCKEQIGNNPPRWGNRILVEVVEKAMDTLPKIAPAEPQTVKTLIELTKFTSTTGQFRTKNLRGVTSTPFREDGVRLLGEIAESQEDQRKQIVPPLVAVLKEAVEQVSAADAPEFSILQNIAQVDEAGNALLKCGPDGKDVLIKTVVPKLNDLQFNKSEQVRKTAEALKKKIEEGQ